MVPSKPGSASSGPYGLRIWEGTDKQRAIFTNVTSFRDLSIPIQVAAVRKFGTEGWYEDDGKTWVGDRADLVERQWLSVDEVIYEEPAWWKEIVKDDLDKRVVKRW